MMDCRRERARLRDRRFAFAKALAVALQASMLLVTVGCVKDGGERDTSNLSGLPTGAGGTGGVAGGMVGDAAISGTTGAGSVDAMLLSREQICAGPEGGVGIGLNPDEGCIGKLCGDRCDPCYRADSCPGDGMSYVCDRHSRCLAVELRD
jgi:hypothetical protein